MNFKACKSYFKNLKPLEVQCVATLTGLLKFVKLRCTVYSAQKRRERKFVKFPVTFPFPMHVSFFLLTKTQFICRKRFVTS